MQFGKNTSFPSLTPTYIRRNNKSPIIRYKESTENLMDMDEIQQEQYYIEKLREQRHRMELFKEQFQRKDEKIRELENELDSVKSKDNQSKYLHKIELLEMENLNLIREKEELNISFRVLKSELFNAKEEMQNANEYVNDKDNETQNLRFKLSKQYQLIQQLKDHINCIYKQHEWQLKQLQKQMQNYKSRNEDNRRELDNMRKQNSELRTKNNEYQLEFEKRRHHIDALAAENSRLKEEVEMDKQELGKVVGSLNSYKSVAEFRQNEYARNMETNLRKAEDKIHKLMKMNKSYKAKIKQHDECVKQLLHDIQVLKLKNHSLNEEFRKQQQIVMNYTVLERKYLESIDKLKTQLKQKDRQRGVKGQGQAKLKAEVDRLRHQLYVLRSDEVDKMDKVFKSFDVSKRL